MKKIFIAIVVFATAFSLNAQEVTMQKNEY